MKEETKLDLAKLFLDYSINNKKIDKNYIDKLINITVNGKELNNYVKDYKIYNINPPEPNMVANYNAGSKTISLYTKELCKHIEDSMEYMYLLMDDERYLYNYIITAQLILHELEHANQKRIMDNKDNLESRILKLCEFEEDELIKRENKTEEYLYKIKQMYNYRENYYELYSYAPHERLAQIKSFQEIIDILYIIKDYAKNIIDYEESDKLANILNGYKDSYSPTITYLSSQGREKDLKDFDWYSDNKKEAIKLSKEKYNLKDRMKYGLPIDEQEHQYVKELFVDKFQKFLKI